MAARAGKMKRSDESRYQAMDRLFPVLMMVAVVALPVSIILSVSIGEVHIDFVECYRILVYKLTGMGHPQSSEPMMSIVWLARVPRILMAALIGAGLAICGVVMQSSVQNPLADPYILGTSSGASLGATFVIMLGLGGISWVQQVGVSTAAFIGATSSSLLVLVIAGAGGRMTSVKLVLAGTVLNMVCSTFSSLIIYLFPNEEGMKSVAYWMMGSLSATGMRDLPVLAVLIPLAILLFFTQARVMNTMMLGDETAVTLGVNTTKSRVWYMIVSALLVGFMVTKSGIVGYVGLIIPHITRGMVGTNHKRLIPFAAVMGALFLLWCDVIGRSIMGVFGHPGELPLGLITSMIGAPMLLHRIIKQGFATNDH
jgi:iron complex transport system permease protein